MPSGLKLSVVLVDVSEVLSLHCLLELVLGLFDGCLLVSRDLVAVLLEVLLCLEAHTVGIVDLVDTLLLSLVSSLVSLSLIPHPLDLSVRKS